MYARTGEFRIDLLATDAHGNTRVENPSALTRGAAPGAQAVLGGSDHWRAGSATVLVAHIDDLARHACHDLGAAAIDVTIHERPDPERITTRRVACPQ